VTAWNDWLGRPYSALVPAAPRRAVARAIQGAPWPLRRYAARSFLALPPGPRALFYENFAVFPTALQQHLLADPSLLAARGPYAEELACYHAAGGSALESMSRADLQTYLVELLMKQDQMSMAASIETACPSWTTSSSSTPARSRRASKLRGWRTKAVLRTALRDAVPAAILTPPQDGLPGTGRSMVPGAVPISCGPAGPRAAGARRRLFSPAALQRLADEHARTGAHGDRLWLLANSSCGSASSSTAIAHRAGRRRIA